MKKSNIFSSGDKRKVNPDWFTSKVWMKVISARIKSEEQDIYHVHFEKGARTKLHQHNGSQVLIAVEGNGSLVTYRRYGTNKSNFQIKRTQTIPLKKGDTVYIPAKTLHTHGSTNPKKQFSHIAINILPSKNSIYKTDWYESNYRTKVTSKI